MHHQKLQQAHHPVAFVSLLFNTIIVGIIGFFLLFMLPSFFDFPGEYLSVKEMEDHRSSSINDSK